MKKDTELAFQVFDYLEELDAFVVNQEYNAVARYLGLYEWHSMVWIGRFFTLDSDYGEHWFDNWELRDERQSKAQQLGIRYEELMVIDPFRFKMQEYRGDGPCHSDQQIKLFWTDVLKSLKLSLAILIEEARKNKADWEKSGIEDAREHEYIVNLEERILEIRNKKAGS